MIGYGIAYIGQGSSYNFMAAYFVVFMTDCVGMNSALAGTIASVALCFEVVAGMIVGNMSDNCTSPMGKRRPFMLTSALLMPIVIVLLMRTVEMSPTATFAYYLILSICFRLLFSNFEIPNSALGAEIATGYDERTRLRTSSRVFSILGNALGYIMPLLVLQFFAGDQSKGWQVIGLIIGFAVFISWMTSFVMTKKKSVIGTKKAKQKNVLKNIARNYLELCKLKSVKILIVYKAAFSCAFALFNVGTIYYLKYSLGLDNRYSSYMYVLTIMVFIIMTPIADKMAISYGKANQQMITMLIGAVIGFAVYFTAPSSLIGAAAYVVGFSVMQTSFWQLSSSIFYDVVEVDEYANFKRREGDVMSMISVLGTLITAVVVQVFGLLLNSVGFVPEAAMQPDSVVGFLNGAYILVPSIFFTVGFVALRFFPITKRRFESLKKAIELRSEGKDFSAYVEDVEKLL